MPESLKFDVLREAVAGAAAAFRCRRRLQPGGGEGDKVFPPTYAGAVYAIEDRRLPGRDNPVRCVVLDSVQSQANRMELALQEAIDAGKIKMPLVVVDFSEHGPTGDVDADKEAGRLIDAIGRITSLQAPHRLADAILRDSMLDDVPFRKSDKGRALDRASLANATPLFELCPTAAVFGMWDSTGPKGGLGAKFERAMVSEVVGVGVAWQDDYRSRGVRRDPLEIRAAVKVVKRPDKTWSVADAGQPAKDTVKPSEVNHSSILFDSPNSGVTIEYAEQTTTLSLICLRRLRFPIDGVFDAKRDTAARTVLAALGLVGATLAFGPGMALRSRCLLWPEGPMEWEILERPGVTPVKYSLTGDEAVALLNRAIEEAGKTGLTWPTKPVVLKPSPDLLKLVRLSQLEATKESGEAS